MEKQERKQESRKESHGKEDVKPNPKVVESREEDEGGHRQTRR